MDQVFVDNVVRQVLQAMAQKGVTVAPAPMECGGRVPSTLGTATPLWISKREDHGIQSGVTAAALQRTAGAAKPCPPKKVFLTANMLLARIGGKSAFVLELAANEYLTPNAQELAQMRNLTVVRGEIAHCQLPIADSTTRTTPAAPRHLTEPRAMGGNPQSAIRIPQLAFMVDRCDDKVRSMLMALDHEGIALSPVADAGCPITNLRSLCDQVAGGSLGVAILPYAADAMVLANKHRSIRAVQGTRLASVQAAVRRFDANLLVLEHALSTFHEMRSMLRAFVAPRSSSAGTLLTAMNQWEK